MFANDRHAVWTGSDDKTIKVWTARKVLEYSTKIHVVDVQEAQYDQYIEGGRNCVDSRVVDF